MRRRRIFVISGVIGVGVHCTFLKHSLITTQHRRRARAFRAFTVKAHFVVQSGSVVHWRQKNREKKAKKRKKIDKRKEK